MAAGLADSVGVAVVDVSGSVEPDPGVPMFVGVPAEEAVAERTGVLDAAEPLREVWPVLQGLELCLGEGLVVRAVRPGVALGHARSASRNATGLEAIEDPRRRAT